MSGLNIKLVLSDEKDISAKPKEKSQQTWVSQPHEHQSWT
jgi:hypothetical protein